ncbi:MAG: hypothetical protein GKR94_34285 [Gammaproteobacteria bacterium]|nr:hypothetical protein [Gammaproteobacteria bacterium]
MNCKGPGLVNEPSPDTFLTASAAPVALSPDNHGPRAGLAFGQVPEDGRQVPGDGRDKRRFGDYRQHVH